MVTADGADSYLLCVLLTQQRGKSLLLCLLPSALCHLPGSCWVSLAQGYGMGSLEMPSHGCVTRGWQHMRHAVSLAARLSQPKHLPLDVLLAQLSSKQRDSLGHLQQSLRQCPFPISPVATNVQTPSQACKHPPMLSCVPQLSAFMGTLHSTNEFPTHPMPGPASPPGPMPALVGSKATVGTQHKALGTGGVELPRFGC